MTNTARGGSSEGNFRHDQGAFAIEMHWVARAVACSRPFGPKAGGDGYGFAARLTHAETQMAAAAGSGATLFSERGEWSRDAQ